MSWKVFECIPFANFKLTNFQSMAKGCVSFRLAGYNMVLGQVICCSLPLKAATRTYDNNESIINGSVYHAFHHQGPYLFCLQRSSPFEMSDTSTESSKAHMSSQKTLSNIIIALELRISHCKSLSDQIYCLHNERCQIFNVVVSHCHDHDRSDHVACLENCEGVLAGIIQKMEYTRDQLQEYMADLRRTLTCDLVSGGSG